MYNISKQTIIHSSLIVLLITMLSCTMYQKEPSYYTNEDSTITGIFRIKDVVSTYGYTIYLSESLNGDIFFIVMPQNDENTERYFNHFKKMKEYHLTLKQIIDKPKISFGQDIDGFYFNEYLFWKDGYIKPKCYTIIEFLPKK